MASASGRVLPLWEGSFCSHPMLGDEHRESFYVNMEQLLCASQIPTAERMPFSSTNLAFLLDGQQHNHNKDISGQDELKTETWVAGGEYCGNNQKHRWLVVYYKLEFICLSTSVVCLVLHINYLYNC